MTLDTGYPGLGMTGSRVSVLVVTALVLAVSFAGSVAARRPATRVELAALVHALPKAYRTGIAKAPTGCVMFVARVSASGRYAEVTPRFSSRARCIRYASDGFFLLRRTATGWKTIYNGSDEPPCSLGVPRDLIACARS